MVCFGKQRSKLSTNTIIFLLNSVKSSSSSVFSAAISFGADRASSLRKSLVPSCPLSINLFTASASSSFACPLNPLPTASIALEAIPNIGTPAANAAPSVNNPNNLNLLILLLIFFVFLKRLSLS